MGKKSLSIFSVHLLATLLSLTACSIDSKISSLKTLSPPSQNPPPPSGPSAPLTPGHGQIPFAGTFQTLVPNEQLVLPLRQDNGWTYDVVVDWGDGTTEPFSSSNPVPVQHTYQNAGSYNVRFWGQADAFSFASIPHSKDKIRTVSNIGNLGWISMSGAFEDTLSLSALSVGTGAATDSVASFENFLKNSSVSSLDLTGMDTTAALNMAGMFEGLALTHLDLSHFDTSAVQNMRAMFKNNSHLSSLNISNWNTTQVLDMSELFLGASSLNPSVASFSFAAVTNASGMLSGTALDTAHYDIFLQRAASTSLTNRNVVVGSAPASHTYSATYLNYKNELTNSNLKNWTIQDIPNVNNKIILVYNLNAGNHNLTLPVNSQATNWAHEDGTANSSTYRNEFTVSINGAHYNSFTNQRRQNDNSSWRNNHFYELSPSDTPLADRTSHGASVVVTINAPTAGEYIIELDGRVEKLSYGGSCPSSLIRVDSLGNTDLRSLGDAFSGCSGLTWVGHGNLANVTTMSGFLRSTPSLTWVDTENYDVRNVRSFAQSFRQARNLEYLNFSKWQTSSALEFAAMFDFSNKINPDISSFDFSKVLSDHYDGWVNREHMNRIFSGTAISTENYTKFLIRFADDTYGIKHNLTSSPVQYLRLNLWDVSRYNDPLPKIDVPYTVEACPAIAKLNNLLSDIPQAVSDGAVGFTVEDDAGLEGGGSCPP